MTSVEPNVHPASVPQLGRGSRDFQEDTCEDLFVFLLAKNTRTWSFRTVSGFLQESQNLTSSPFTGRPSHLPLRAFPKIQAPNLLHCRAPFSMIFKPPSWKELLPQGLAEDGCQVYEDLSPGSGFSGKGVTVWSALEWGAGYGFSKQWNEMRKPTLMLPQGSMRRS